MSDHILAAVLSVLGLAYHLTQIWKWLDKAYNQGKSADYHNGVLDGWMLGRHPKELTTHPDYKKAVEIIDEIEAAAVVWEKVNMMEDK